MNPEFGHLPATGTIHLLLLEDCEADQARFEAYVGLYNKPVGITIVTNLMDALAMLEHGCFDMIFADLVLPDALDLDAVHMMVLAAPDTPLVVLTGNADPKLARVARAQGAQDYVHKDDLSPETLSRMIDYAMKRAELTGTEPRRATG